MGIVDTLIGSAGAVGLFLWARSATREGKRRGDAGLEAQARAEMGPPLRDVECPSCHRIDTRLALQADKVQRKAKLSARFLCRNCGYSW